MTSSTGTSAFLDSDSDDDHELNSNNTSKTDLATGLNEDETWSLELINEALKNVAKPDKLSAYERRVALREIKDIVRGILESSDVTLEDPKAHDYLKMNENTDTLKQLLCLRNEMVKLLTMKKKLDSEKKDLCRKIKELWIKADYVASDVLEVKIKAGGSGIPSSPHTIAVLHAIYDVWAGVFKPISLADGTGRLTMMLDGCFVPTDLKDQILKFASKSPPALYCACERLSASLTEYGLILGDLNKLGKSTTSSSSGEVEGGRDKVDDDEKSTNTVFESQFGKEDDYREELLKIEERCRRWETMSGVPFYASIGSHFLLRSKNVSDPIVEVIKNHVREMNSMGVQ